MEGVERRWGVGKTGEEFPRVHTELDENPVGPPASPGPAGMDSSETGVGILDKDGVCAYHIKNINGVYKESQIYQRLSDLDSRLIRLAVPLQGMGPALQSLVRRNYAFRSFLWLFHPINSTAPAQDS